MRHNYLNNKINKKIFSPLVLLALVIFALALALALALWGCVVQENLGLPNSATDPVVYTHVDIIDGVSSSILLDHTVIIDRVEGKILDIFSNGIKDISSASNIVGLSGKVMMPGLIEGHYHLVSGVGEQTNEGGAAMRFLFQKGVTTIRDMAGNGVGLSLLKDLGSKRELPYSKIHFSCLVAGRYFMEVDPRIRPTAGNSVAGDVIWLKKLVDTTDVSALINEARDFGCSGIKLYADFKPDNAKRVIIEGKKQNFPVWAHGTLFKAGPWDILGVDSFSHVYFLSYVSDEIPDITNVSSGNFQINYNIDVSSSTMKEYLEELNERNTVLDLTLSPLLKQASKFSSNAVNFLNEVTKTAHHNQVLLGVGVDLFDDTSDPNSFLLLEELKAIKNATGMSNLEVLKTATINNAIALKIDNNYGTVEVGKKADLIVLNKNPLEDLDNLKSIYMVMKDGFEHKF